MNTEKLYTKQELDIELLKQSNEKFKSSIEKSIDKLNDSIEKSNEEFNVRMEKYSEEEFKKQLEMELLKNNQSHLFKTLDRIDYRLNSVEAKLESNQKWILGLMGTGFLGILGLIAHGFKWIL